MFDGNGMTKNRLEQYSSRLTTSEIAVGMNAAAANARRLLEDAETMLSSGRYPSAFCLAVLSIEESGKLPILRALALARDQKELSDVWRDFRSHRSKNKMWILLDMFMNGARRLEEFRPMFADDAEHASLLDNLKQIGFYTDCLGKRHWSIPDEVIDQSLASQIVAIAAILAPKRQVTEKEIALWVKHMKPVWHRNQEHMEAGLSAWHREMVASGLSDADPETMERFILEGVARKGK